MHDYIKKVNLENISINNQDFKNFGDHDFMIKKYLKIHSKIKKFI